MGINPKDFRTATDNILRWKQHPATMVRELFGAEPDAWQDDVLEAFPHKQRIALLACKGPGKSTVLAWLGWNFLLTRPHPKIAATSVTGDNLSDNLWTEMAKWQGRSDLLKNLFQWTKTRIFARDHPETWWMAARTWPQSGDRDRQAETLAGLHADYLLFLVDESGSIPDTVMVAAEAALATGRETHIVQAGNPNTLDGPLYSAHRHRHLWHVVEITGDPDNPKRSPRVSLEWAREQISLYGADSPWVQVNVFGRFPASSLNALIGVAEVEAAMDRVYTEYDVGVAAMVLGVDVARFGDDASVIFPRRGIQAFKPHKLRNIDSTAGAGVVVRMWDNMQADGVFVDNSGGYGAGWIDQILKLGRAPIGIEFGGGAHNRIAFGNKRAEMYFDAVHWIKQGGALPKSRELIEALTRTTYTFAKNGQSSAMLIEPKADVKAKLGYSPDEADAFVLTFAEPVSPAARHGDAKPRHQSDWDPYAGMGTLDKLVAGAYDNRRGEYDPFGSGGGPYR